MKKERLIYALYQFVTYILLILMICITVNKKCDYYIDELYSYWLSNNIITVHNSALENNMAQPYVVYSPASDAYTVSLAVSDSFNYSNVWQRQIEDTHPPLYYAVLHTICSFFPGKFSIWFGEIVNIFIAVIVLILFRKIIDLFTRNVIIRELLSLCYVFSVGNIVQSTFIRMYMMATMLMLFNMYCVGKMIMDKKVTWKHYVFFLTSIICGMLTHYYCIVFAATTGICLVLIQLATKQLREAIVTSLTGILSVAMAIAIFPGMLRHFVASGHATNAVHNVHAGRYELLQRIKWHVDVINSVAYGHVLLLWIVLIITFCVMFFILNKRSSISEILSSRLFVAWITMACGSLVYFIFVAVTSTWMLLRYMAPIYPMAFLTIAIPVVVLCDRLKIKNCALKKYGNMSIIAVSLLTLVLGWVIQSDVNNEYLYLNRKVDFDNARLYSEYDCFVLYDTSIPITDFAEKVNYYSVMFVPCSDTDRLGAILSPVQKCLISIPQDWDVSNILSMTNYSRAKEVCREHSDQQIQYVTYFVE